MLPMHAPAQIKQAAYDLGFDLVGVCWPDAPASFTFFENWLAAGFAGSMAYLERHRQLRADPATLLSGVRSVIAVGLNYHQEPATRAGYPKVARYALGRDYHRVIRSRLKRLASSLPGGKHRICVDSAPILEREYAHRAGLGWFGKNTMLIDSRSGSWFVIGLLLTTLEIEPDEPASGGCGTCRACIDACPTGAIVWLGERWAVDARQCISYLTIEQPDEADARVGDWTFGCDVCQEVCPFNARRDSQPLRARQTSEPDFLRHSPIPGMTLEEIERLTPEEWDEATQGSPIRRSGYEGLIRIAGINRENSKP